LASLNRQTCQDFRIVLVLDECHRETMDRLNDSPYVEWRDSGRLQIFARQARRGLAAAKNFGLSKCQAEFVAYQDADDASLECRLELQMKYLREHPDIDLLFCENWDVYNPLEPNEVWYPNCFPIGKYNSHEQIAARLSIENVLSHGSLMARRECLLVNGGYSEDERWTGMEDWGKWCDLMEQGYKFAKYPERLYLWSCGTSVAR
jgi:glycosyltransferase involved in cell wall biosynthesis